MRGRGHASERFVRFERNREGAFFHSFPNNRRKKAVLGLLKKRVDAKSDAAAHVPPSQPSSSLSLQFAVTVKQADGCQLRADKFSS